MHISTFYLQLMYMQGLSIYLSIYVYGVDMFHSSRCGVTWLSSRAEVEMSCNIPAMIQGAPCRGPTRLTIILKMGNYG